MGRSQVERNRARGRPGSKGRGGRGRGGRGGDGGDGRGRGGGGGGGRAGKPDLGSNAWRYEQDGHDEVGAADVLVDDMVTTHYAEHGAAHHDVASALFAEEDASTSEAGPSQGTFIDLDALANALRKLPTATRLDMPEHIAKLYDEKYGEAVDESRAKTISELRVAAAAAAPAGDDGGSTSASTKKQGDSSGKVSADRAASAAVQDTDKGKEEDGEAEEEEEDLDAWLDSVI